MAHGEENALDDAGGLTITTLIKIRVVIIIRQVNTENNASIGIDGPCR